MSEKLTYLDCWTRVATALFAQALAGEPILEESLPKPLPEGSEGFVVTLSGDQSGRFTVLLDAGIFAAPLLGEGTDQRAGWMELLREVADAAVGDLLAKAGIQLHVESFEPSSGESKVSRAFVLKSGDNAWTVLVRDEVRAPKGVAQPASPAAVAAQPATTPISTESLGNEEKNPVNAASRTRANGVFDGAAAGAPLTPGLELLLDIELEASLRFGAREMQLSEILELGPGDVVQLDRHIADPVDLIIGDKIVARGEVVLVNGNFGLRVSEVAAPRRRLESIRCLF